MLNFISYDLAVLEAEARLYDAERSRLSRLADRILRAAARQQI